MKDLCCIEEKCVSKNDCPIIRHFYEQGRLDTIDEYKQRLLEDLIPLKDKYFDIAKGTSMPERYTHLKRMDTVDLIIEMVELKAEQLKEQKYGVEI